MGMGPDDVDGNIVDPDDGSSGNRPLGLLTGGNVGPQASPGRSNGLVDGIAPLGGGNFSWPLGRMELLAGG